jgi:hypothetical protein
VTATIPLYCCCSERQSGRDIRGRREREREQREREREREREERE